MGGGGNKTSTTTSGTPDWTQPYIESAAKDAQSLYKAGQLDQVAGLNADQRASANDIRNTQGRGVAFTDDANALYRQAGQGGAYDQAHGVSTAAADGTGIFGADAYGSVANQMQPMIDNQITQALGQQSGAFSQTGNLGGARAQAASAGAAGQIAGQMSQAEVQAQRSNAFGGAQLGVGTADTQFGQRVNSMSQRGSALNSEMAANQQYAQSGQAQQDQRQAELDAKYQGIQRMFGLINPGTVGSTQTTASTGGK
jgi:hypothetical protein